MIRAWLISVLTLMGFLIGTYLILTYALPLVIPFAVALVAAELMDPLVTWLTWKGRIPRTLTVIVVMVIFVGLIITAVTIGIARLVVEIQDMAASLPYLYAVGVDLSARFADQFGAFHATLPASIQEMLSRNLLLFQQAMSGLLPSLQTTLGVFSGLPIFLADLLVSVIATFFISKDRRKIFDFLLDLFPEPWRPKLRQVKVQVWSSAMGFAKAQLFLLLLTMVQAIVGLSLIGANYAVLVGVTAGLADLLPMLGPASIFVPWIAYSLLFGSKLFGIKLLILYVVLAGVRTIIEPKVVGERVGLHPLATLFAVYMGFRFFGALGFVLGPLIAIFLKAMMYSGLLPDLQEQRPPA